MLFNEPKLLKCANLQTEYQRILNCFSALQRAEIAEMTDETRHHYSVTSMSFSALQRAEIAEIVLHHHDGIERGKVSVLFNEPKLLKC